MSWSSVEADASTRSLGSSREPARDRALLRAGQRRHRRDRGERRHRRRAHRRRARTSRDAARSTLTVVGPEQPLVLGIVDAFERDGLRIFGPSRRGAELEGSKAFTKELLVGAGVPTARHHVCDDADAARARDRRPGRAGRRQGRRPGGGQGRRASARRAAEAHAAVDDLMTRRMFGDAGAPARHRGVPRGRGSSRSWRSPTAARSCRSRRRRTTSGSATATRDRTPAAWAPTRRRRCVTPALERSVMHEIIEPVVAELRRRGIVYRGVLYAGLMVREGRAAGPRVQRALRRSGVSGPDAAAALRPRRVDRGDARRRPVRLPARVGSARECRRRARRRGLSRPAARPATSSPASTRPPIAVAWCSTPAPRGATARSSPPAAASSTVAALGDDLASAVARAYDGVTPIGFTGAHYRKDIGRRALLAPARKETT